MDDVWDVCRAAELAGKTCIDLLRGVVSAWKNDMLKMFLDNVKKDNEEELPQGVKEFLAPVKEVYSDPRLPCFSGDIKDFLGDPAPRISAPIFAIASRTEFPKGETEAKMESWRDLTTSSFRLITVDSDHFEIIKTVNGKCAAFDAVLQDMKTFVA